MYVSSFVHSYEDLRFEIRQWPGYNDKSKQINVRVENSRGDGIPLYRLMRKLAEAISDIMDVREQSAVFSGTFSFILKYQGSLSHDFHRPPVQNRKWRQQWHPFRRYQACWLGSSRKRQLAAASELCPPALRLLPSRIISRLDVTNIGHPSHPETGSSSWLGLRPLLFYSPYAFDYVIIIYLPLSYSV